MKSRIAFSGVFKIKIRALVVIGVLFLLGGMGALLIVYILYRRLRYFKDNVITVQGRVVAIQIRKSRSSQHTKTLKRPILQYIFQGQIWEHMAEYDVDKYQQKLNSWVDIYLQPQYPNLVLSVHDRHELKIMLKLCLSLTILFVCLGIYMLVKDFNQIKNYVYDSKFVIGVVVTGLVLAVYMFWNRQMFLFMFDIHKNKAIWGMSDNAIRLERSCNIKYKNNRKIE